jgi:hypothetical protein
MPRPSNSKSVWGELKGEKATGGRGVGLLDGVPLPRQLLGLGSRTTLAAAAGSGMAAWSDLERGGWRCHSGTEELGGRIGNLLE